MQNASSFRVTKACWTKHLDRKPFVALNYVGSRNEDCHQSTPENDARNAGISDAIKAQGPQRHNDLAIANAEPGAAGAYFGELALYTALSQKSVAHASPPLKLYK